MTEPVFTSLWANGAKMEFYYQKEPLEGEEPNDRIQILLYPADSNPRGYVMNMAEANDMIYGLSNSRA